MTRTAKTAITTVAASGSGDHIKGVNPEHDHDNAATDAAIVAAIKAHEDKFHAPAVEPPPIVTPPPSQYTFEDNFTTLNLSVWKPTYQVGDFGYGADTDFKGNLSQVSIVTEGSDTFARITAHKVRNTGLHDWDSASMGTNGTFSQRYGTWEARVRYPAAQGEFPAFWLIAPGPVTSPPEFDIFEAYPSNGPGGSGLNYLSSGGNTTLGIYPAGSPLAPPLYYDARGSLAGAWHVHKMVWAPAAIQLWIDGIDRGTYTDAAKIATLPAMYPIFTHALGVLGVYRADATTPTTLYMDIDYIRITA